MANGVRRGTNLPTRGSYPGRWRGTRGTQGVRTMRWVRTPLLPHYYLRIQNFGVRGVRTNTERIGGRARACGQRVRDGSTRGRMYGGSFAGGGSYPGL